MEQGQETDTENKERGGGLRALDGNEGGQKCCVPRGSKNKSHLYHIMQYTKLIKYSKKNILSAFQIMNYYITYIKKCISI